MKKSSPDGDDNALEEAEEPNDEDDSSTTTPKEKKKGKETFDELLEAITGVASKKAKKQVLDFATELENDFATRLKNSHEGEFGFDSDADVYIPDPQNFEDLKNMGAMRKINTTCDIWGLDVEVSLEKVNTGNMEKCEIVIYHNLIILQYIDNAGHEVMENRAFRRFRVDRNVIWGDNEKLKEAMEKTAEALPVLVQQAKNDDAKVKSGGKRQEKALVLSAKKSVLINPKGKLTVGAVLRTASKMFWEAFWPKDRRVYITYCMSSTYKCEFNDRRLAAIKG